MKQDVPFNLNDYIKVKLSDEGFEFWRQSQTRDLFPELNQPIEYYKGKADENGYVQFQAWVFITIFGKTIVFGKTNKLFHPTVLIVIDLPQVNNLNE